MKNKKILVSGGAGFIGSHLCKKLLENGNFVICVDNFFTGNRDNISTIISNSNFSLIEHDIINKLEIEVDQIYNLACPASPVHYQIDRIRTMKTNINGSINMLNVAKKNKARILQASTSEIYGNPEVHPQEESYAGNVNPIGPRACYDEGKRAAETLFFDYFNQYDVDIRVIRIFNTYGPYMQVDDGRVVSNFINQAIANKPITIYGDGSQTRSFCYVEDMVRGIIDVMNQDLDRGPINIGNQEEITVVDLAKDIIRLTNSKSKIVHNELPIDDPVRRKPDLKKAEKVINWITRVKREEGLKKTIDYFRNLEI